MLACWFWLMTPGVAVFPCRRSQPTGRSCAGFERFARGTFKPTRATLRPAAPDRTELSPPAIEATGSPLANPGGPEGGSRSSIRSAISSPGRSSSIAFLANPHERQARNHDARASWAFCPKRRPRRTVDALVHFLASTTGTTTRDGPPTASRSCNGKTLYDQVGLRSLPRRRLVKSRRSWRLRFRSGIRSAASTRYNSLTSLRP